MTLSKVNSYINPCSSAFSRAKKDFKALSLLKKITTVALSTIAALATFFLLGVGGFATFRAVVECFKEKKIEDPVDIEESIIASSDSNELLSEIVEEKSLNDLLKSIIKKFDIYEMRSFSLQKNIYNEENNRLKDMIFLYEKIEKMSLEEEKNLLFTAEGMQEYELIAWFLFRKKRIKGLKDQSLPIEVDRFFSEGIIAGQKYKQDLLLELIKESLYFKKAISCACHYIKNKSIFTVHPKRKIHLKGANSIVFYYCLSLDLSKIFSAGSEYTTISKNLAKVIGSVIQQIIQENKETSVDGFLLEINAKTSASLDLIKPVFSYLKNSSGIIALDVNIDEPYNEKKEYFFKKSQQEIEEIIKTNPYLVRFKIKIGDKFIKPRKLLNKSYNLISGRKTALHKNKKMFFAKSR